MNELGQKEMTIEDYKEKYELAIEERDKEILRTLNQHDDILELQEQMKQREVFTKAAIRRLKDVTMERDHLKDQLEKLKLIKKKSCIPTRRKVTTDQQKQNVQQDLPRSELLLESQRKLKETLSKYQIIPTIESTLINETAKAEVLQPTSFFVSLDTSEPKVSTPPKSPLPALRRPKSFFVSLTDDCTAQNVQNCMNPFKVLPPVAGKTPTPPIVRRRSSVQTPPIVCRRSSVQTAQPAVRRRSSVQKKLPPIRWSSSTQISAPAVQKCSSVRTSPPAVRRRSSVETSPPAVRRRSSVETSPPAVRRRSSVQTTGGNMPLTRSIKKSVYFVLPGIGEQIHF